MKALFKKQLNFIRSVGLFFLPALYLFSAGTVALIWRNLLPEVLSLTILFLGVLLGLITYRLVLFRRSVLELLKRVEAQVIIMPKGTGSHIFDPHSEDIEKDQIIH